MKHLTVALKDDRRGLALLSKLTPSTALIFVHGFWGKPRSTWVDFCNLIEDDAKWNNCDVYFYGHRSNKQVRTLADKFLPFLQAVAAGGRQVLGARLKIDVLRTDSSREAPIWGYPVQCVLASDGTAPMLGILGSILFPLSTFF